MRHSRQDETIGNKDSVTVPRYLVCVVASRVGAWGHGRFPAGVMFIPMDGHSNEGNGVLGPTQGTCIRFILSRTSRPRVDTGLYNSFPSPCGLSSALQVNIRARYSHFEPVDCAVPGKRTERICRVSTLIPRFGTKHSAAKQGNPTIITRFRKRRSGLRWDSLMAGLLYGMQVSKRSTSIFSPAMYVVRRVPSQRWRQLLLEERRLGPSNRLTLAPKAPPNR